MTIADSKKRTHIVDFILYTWQMEDLIRAAQFQPRLLEEWAENQAQAEGTDPDAERQWLMALAEDLRQSGAVEKGHATLVKDAMAELAHLHELLLGMLQDSQYQEAFEQAKPLLEDLSDRLPTQAHPVEQLALALYGWMVLRLKKEAISAETEAAMRGLRNWANALAKGHIQVYYPS